ncbi:MAG: membrane protein insertase YidC [Hyphomonadaceae bacterium]|nr:membrane protein insertase YidC [Hyphomonadaceae bacterium]
MLHDQDNQKNLLLAIVLSVAVLLAWQFFYAGPKLKEEQERQARIRSEQQQAKAKETAPGAPVGAPDAAPGKPGAVPGPSPVTTAANRQAAVAASPRLAIETPSIKGSLALKGGRIDDIVLSRYHETVDRGSPNVVLFSPSGAPHPYYAEYGWVAAAGVTQPTPGAETLWRVEKDGPLTPRSPITLAWDNGQGLIFRRTITVDEDYLFTVADEVENKTGSAVALHPYALISRHGMPKIEGFYILHEGPIGVLGAAGLQELGYADLLKEGGSKSFKQTTGGWLGFTDKYWAAALLPSQTAPYEARFSGAKGPKDTFQADFSSGAVTIAPGAKQTVTSHLFAGAKVVSLIEAYGEKLGAARFDMLVDWGWFWFFTKPLFKLLHWLGLMLGNYGLAILATTVLVKLVFFPLANKSYESMAKMKMLQPEMEKLRERYKDDRAKQQQELMTLYRDKKINPMAGCLPILLQIPVFFALYKVLFITIDMRHAPFYGWIKDLSAPDPTSIFNLFGLLPFAVPELLHVGVWPIIMGITMWVQMQLNPQQPDPIQQKIFNWMPVMFTFLLASFSVGLVIYWAWNNVLSLIQQYAIMRRNGAEIHLWKNTGLDKLAARVRSGEGLDIGGTVARGGASLRRGAEALGQRLGSGKTSGTSKGPSGPQGSTATSQARSADGAGLAGAAEMTREQALQTLGLQPGATPTEIDAAYSRRTRQNGSLNGSEKLSQAREVLRGKEGA